MTILRIKTGQGDPVIITGDSLSKTEKKIGVKRARRNATLAETDSKIVTDRGMSESKVSEWLTYRQELRDMDFSDPNNLTLPTRPEE